MQRLELLLDSIKRQPMRKLDLSALEGARRNHLWQASVFCGVRTRRVR